MKNFTIIIIFSVLFSGGVYAQEVKILLMGDTQKIMDQQSDRFLTTMDKILTDSTTNDAAFILQMGDIVETDAEEFLDKFPLKRYQSWPSFVSNYNDHRNVAHQFNAGEVDWLVLSVRFNANEDEMKWAESLIKNNPHKKVIFISHAANENGAEVKMCKKYENVVLVLCGHSYSRHKLHSGNNGQKMGWIKTCHHSVDKDSYLCMVVFNVKTGVANCRYYSPLYGRYWDEAGAPYSIGQPENSPWTWSGFQLQ